jgi:hypothetical protein
VIRTRSGEDAKVALRLDDHEMDVEWPCRRPSDRFQHDWPNGDVGHVSTVHHIDMNPISTGSIHRPYFIAEMREVS